MAITTFTVHSEQQDIHNKEITELLKELPGDNWLVEEIQIDVGRWYKKKLIYQYKLLYKLNDVERQVINFYRDDPDMKGFDIYVGAELIIAFMYGLLNREKL